MNQDQLGGVIRAILPPFIAYAVAKGWINAGSADWIIASIVGIGTAIWSAYTNRPGTVIPSK